MWRLKYDSNEHLRNRNRLTNIENRPVAAKGERGCGGMEWKCGASRCKPLYPEWMHNQVLLHSIGNCIHYSMRTHNGEEYLKKGMHLHEQLNHLANINNTVNQPHWNVLFLKVYRVLTYPICSTIFYQIKFLSATQTTYMKLYPVHYPHHNHSKPGFVPTLSSHRICITSYNNMYSFSSGMYI